MKFSLVFYVLSLVGALSFTPTITREAALQNNWNLVTIYYSSGIPQTMWRDNNGKLYREIQSPAVTVPEDNPSAKVHYDLIQVTDGGSQISSWMFKGPDGRLYREKPADASDE